MTSENKVMTIQERFEAAAGTHAEKIALWDPGKPWTYAYLHALAKQGASGLRMLNPSPNVGIMLPAVREFAMTYFSVLLAGRVPVPINFLLGPDQLKYIVADAGIDTIITSTMFRESSGGIAPKVIYLEELDFSAGALLGPPPPVEAKPDDLATILYTSGTTGRPKGVMLSHRNLLSNCDACAEATELTENDVSLGVLPPFHAFGLTVTTLLPLVTGCEVLYLPKFEPQKVLELLAARGVSVFATLPSMCRVLAKIRAAKPQDSREVRWFIAGGEPLPRSTADAFEKAFGFGLREGYGMTEAAPVITLNYGGEPREKSCGRPLPGIEVRIADDGEIQVKGPNVMLGYHNLADETKAVFTDDGWLRTGDLGYTDDDGYVYINGRAKELIISAGENIFPGEIEQHLADHPKVVAAAVVGAPDKVKGEIPVAHVQLHEGVTIEPLELRDFLKDRLAPFKVPREISVRDLPIGPTGKVIKRLL